MHKRPNYPAYDISIAFEIHDETAFYDAALARAQDDGLTVDQANEMLRPEGDVDLHACAVMLFDPGTSPPGCKIFDSACESF